MCGAPSLGRRYHVDQLATIWSGLPDWVLDAVSRARALPYPALHVIAGVIVLEAIYVDATGALLRH